MVSIWGGFASGAYGGERRKGGGGNRHLKEGRAGNGYGITGDKVAYICQRGRAFGGALQAGKMIDRNIKIFLKEGYGVLADVVEAMGSMAWADRCWNTK